MIVRPGPFICAEWEFGGFPRQDYSLIINQPFLAVEITVKPGQVYPPSSHPKVESDPLVVVDFRFISAFLHA